MRGSLIRYKNLNKNLIKADELEMIVFGFDSVDFGNKKVSQCLNAIQIGHAGSAGKPTSLDPEDHAGCVAWLNNL